MKANCIFIITLFLISALSGPNFILASTPERTLTGHTGPVYSVEFSPKGNMLATKGKDETIRLWDTHTGQLLRTINTNSGGGIAFSPNGEFLASGGGADKVVNLWNTDTGKLQKTLGGHLGYVSYVAFSPNGDVLASGDSNGNIILWDPDTGQLLRTWHADTLDGLTFSADGSFLANGGRDDSNVKVWNPETGQLLHTLKPDVQEVFDVAFSPDGHILASAGWGGIDLWDANTGELLRSFPREHGRFLISVAFSPDGHTLACGKDFEGISLWDVKKGMLLKNLRVNREDVYDVAFSPDGRILASASNDHMVRLWKITPQKEIEPPPLPDFLADENFKTWTEDFNAGHLNSWTKREHQRERVTWQTKNGQLEVYTQPFCNGRLNLNNELALNTNYTLEFTAFPIEAEQLRVKLKVDSTDNANAGIFIGKKPDSSYHKLFQHAYLFANHTLGGPDNWGYSSTPKIGLDLTEMDIVFDRGRFYLYSEGEYIVDFQVNIQEIDYVGIAVFPKKCFEDAAVILDNFEISGPTIPDIRIPKEIPDDRIENKPVEIEGAWVEDFNDGHLDSWTEDKNQKERKRVTWQAKDGHLDVWIQPLLAKAFIQTYELEFTGLPIKAEKLRVKVDVLEAHNANVGMLIGQYDWTGGIFRRTYKILHKSIWGPIEFRGQNPDVRYENLKEIEVVFDNGHFELLSEGEHILEFDEPNLPTIDCLGIVAYTTEVPLAHFVMDNFVISDLVAPKEKSLNINAKGKAAVVWGELKKQ
ncbi:MAG: WD40 repeat domain-containing protein [Candidatus Poribacteria bacterium]|nr:WD40 repeat domain-containing protein [Candidatus Poribacteria bacterium]